MNWKRSIKDLEMGLRHTIIEGMAGSTEHGKDSKDQNNSRIMEWKVNVINPTSPTDLETKCAILKSKMAHI